MPPKRKCTSDRAVDSSSSIPASSTSVNTDVSGPIVSSNDFSQLQTQVAAFMEREQSLQQELLASRAREMDLEQQLEKAQITIGKYQDEKMEHDALDRIVRETYLMYPNDLSGEIKMIEKVSKGLKSACSEEVDPSIVERNSNKHFDLKSLSEFDFISWFGGLASSVILTRTQDDNFLFSVNKNPICNNPNDFSKLLISILQTVGGLDVVLNNDQMLCIYQCLSSYLRLFHPNYLSPVALLTQLVLEEKCSPQLSTMVSKVMPGGMCSTIVCCVRRFHSNGWQR